MTNLVGLVGLGVLLRLSSSLLYQLFPQVLQLGLAFLLGQRYVLRCVGVDTSATPTRVLLVTRSIIDEPPRSTLRSWSDPIFRHGTTPRRCS